MISREIVINLAREAINSLSEFVVFFLIFWKFWFLGPGDPLLDHKQTKNLQDAKA